MPPATDCQNSPSLPSGYFSRSIRSFRRDHFHSTDSIHEPTGRFGELEFFQKQVARRFGDLLPSASADELLSISWIRKLLDAFVCCQEEFKVFLFNNRACLRKPPADKMIAEHFERSVKALDICNAIRDGIEQIRVWQKQMEIVLNALDARRSLGEGQFRRAKKALLEIATSMLDETEADASPTQRNWSFGNNQRDQNKSLSRLRSLSRSVSCNWSASRQVQAIGNNLAAPKHGEIIATNGIALAAYTMGCVLLFVMWALVVSIPCQDRSLQAQFNIRRQFIWAGPILSLHEKISEESKKRDRKSSRGLLREIGNMEKWLHDANELIGSARFPLNEESERKARARVKELGLIYGDMEDGLEPLDKQVKEVFRGIIRSRTNGLDFAETENE